MQIGRGKQGIRIGEYIGEYGYPENSLLPEEINEQERPDTNPVLGYIQPSCDNPQWILWFMANGDAILHQKRTENGEVLDKPMRIKAR